MNAPGFDHTAAHVDLPDTVEALEDFVGYPGAPGAAFTDFATTAQLAAYVPRSVPAGGPSSAPFQAFKTPTLIDPGQTKNFTMLGLDSAGDLWVRDTSLTHQIIRISSNFGSSFLDNAYPPYNWSTLGKICKINGKLLCAVIGATDGLTHVWSAPAAYPSSNLLTDYQASLTQPPSGGTPIGWTAQINCTIKTSNAWVPSGGPAGSQSVAATSTAAGLMRFNTDDANAGMAPVVAGQTYTAVATVRAATVAQTVQMWIIWFNSAFGVVSQTATTSVTDSTTADTLLSNTGVAPSGAVWAAVYITVANTNAGGEVHYAGNVQIAQGTTTTFGAGKYPWTEVLDVGAGTTSWTAGGAFMNTDGTHLWVGTPGDPVGGPSIYTTSDGATFTQTAGPIGTGGFRHVHHITYDPYNANNVWTSLGDNTSGITLPYNYLHSTDGGATWSQVPGPPQGVQMSFSPSWVWVGSDQSSNQPPFFFKRDGSVWYMAAPNSHAMLAVPAAPAGYHFDTNAFFGTIDPSSGIFYCCSGAGANENAGFFYLPEVGAPLVCLAADTLSPGLIAGEMFMGNGTLFFGNMKKPLISGIIGPPSTL